MTKAFVLMTAMPPTKGHRALIEFASRLAPTEVIICTQPGEPFCAERRASVEQISLSCNAHVNYIHRPLPQEPEGNEGFWDMWAEFLTMFGFETGDYIVASERYGRRLAEVVGGNFMPFDIERQINPHKATKVRQSPLANFHWIDETFQSTLIKTITIFGAESTGKTTLSKKLAAEVGGHCLPEYARPYLENTSPSISTASMTNIWHGQRALQDYGQTLRNKPFVIQDTDLFSTVGYWEMSPWAMLKSKCPSQLITDAMARTSDLYIVTPSNIDFEPDPLRYGGDHREISDDKWINFCERYGLPYIVLDSPTRLATAYLEAVDLFSRDALALNYLREGREYRVDTAEEPVLR